MFALGNGTTLGTSTTGVGFGTSGSFFSVSAGTLNITFNTGTGTAMLTNAGNMTFNAGQNFTVILGSATTAGGTPRAFLVPAC